ncbi:MAG: hypothetical protein A2992_03475 [Elusimicrobia bacterium RIFCSPLOWO2_01_FULL_59_12]|nr:MAG: hypothetical protein A2992_03475 [Elusimicrobia bacterium RIFCSPLOWO2_01_FULL_59_12]
MKNNRSDAETGRRGDAETRHGFFTVSPRPCVPVSLLLLLIGCSPRAVVKPAASGGRLERIAVQALEGPAGAEIAGEFRSALEGSDLRVVDPNQKADAFLAGSVVEHKAGRKLLVFLGSAQTVSKDQTLTASNPILSLSGGQTVPLTPATGADSPRIVAENATVGVQVKLVDASGTPLWAEQYSYEALELTTARRAVVKYLARSLKREVPRLRRQPRAAGAQP